jgi:Flp pilus assembly protein, pilin Flp
MNLFVLKSWLQAKFASDEQGASMVEYGLLVALIAVVCIAAVGLIGTRLDTKFDTVGNSLS